MLLKHPGHRFLGMSKFPTIELLLGSLLYIHQLLTTFLWRESEA